MQIAYKKRQAKIEERKAKAAAEGIRVAKVRTAKEAFGENFELMNGRNKCQPPIKMPKHLVNRLSGLSKNRRSKEQIAAKHAEADARRLAALSARQTKAVALAGTATKKSGSSKLEHIEIMPSSSSAATLPEHVRYFCSTPHQPRSPNGTVQNLTLQPTAPFPA